MRKVGFVVLLFLCFGCTKEVDFDQIDQLEIKSKYIASLTYFDLVADDFLDENLNELTQIQDFVIPQLKTENLENVEKMEFTFEFSNSFSREFVARVLYIDTEGEILYEMTPAFEVPANSNSVRMIYSVVPPDIEAIFNAHLAIFQINLLPDSEQPLTIDNPGILNLKSSLTLYLNVKT